MVAGTDATASLSQQFFHDADPLRIKRLSANGLACAVVPIACVPLIAFLAVQVSFPTLGFDLELTFETHGKH